MVVAGLLFLSLSGVNTMDDQSMLDLSMMDPASRRHWLLTKALENASLGKALSLAQAAENFLAGKAQATADRLPRQTPTAASEPEPAVPQDTLLQTLAIPAVWNDKLSEAVEGLSSLASMDDVVRYLRQCDEEIALETDNVDELLARANHKRRSQGLPLFELLPAAPVQATRHDKPGRAERIAPPRPPSARERAEWARRVVALPASVSP
jgi:hypothetical protein